MGCRPDASSTSTSFASVPVRALDSVFSQTAKLRLQPPETAKIGIAGALLLTPTQALIADPTQSSVKVFDRASGLLIRTIGHAGDGPGEFRSPGYLEFDEQGRIAIVDADRHLLARTDTAGNPLAEQAPGNWNDLKTLPGTGRLLLVGRTASGVNPGDRLNFLHEVDSTGQIRASYGAAAIPTIPLEATFFYPFAAASRSLVLRGFYSSNEVMIHQRATGREASVHIGAPWYHPMDFSKPLPKPAGTSGIQAVNEFVKHQVIMSQLFTLSESRFMAGFRSVATDGDVLWAYVVFDSSGHSLIATQPGVPQILRVVGDSLYSVRPDESGDYVIETRAIPREYRRE